MTSDNMTYHMCLGYNYAVASIDYDNVSFYEANEANCVNFISKENVRAVPAQLGNAITGENYSFTLEKDAEVAVSSVSYNGAEVTPVNGVYTVTLTDSRDITVSLANDADYPEAGKDFDGVDLTAYNREAYTTPIWNGETVYNETVHAYDGRTSVSLLYPIDKVVSVRSYDLSTYYVKGVDFDVVDGKLTIPAGSRLLASRYYSVNGPTSTVANPYPSDDAGIYVSQYSQNTTNNNAFCVTYTHTQTWADKGVSGYTVMKQESVESELDVFSKLKNGEDVHLVFYGDSMSSGWSASGGKMNVYTTANDGTTQSSGHYVAPYTPNWMTMFVDGLKAEYPKANITWENLSLGGKDADWGLENFAARYELLENKNVDLFMIGFGINDCGAGVTVDSFKTSTSGIIDAIKAKNPEVSVLLYGANSTNTYLEMYDKETLLGYEAAHAELAASLDNVAATKLTSIYMDVNASKEPCDYLENNINHASDFGCRIYAQVMLAAMGIEINVSAADVELNLNTAGGFESSAGVTSRFDLSTIAKTNGTSHTYTIEKYDTKNLPTGYTEAMGDSYLRFADATTGLIDVMFPIELKANTKKLLHFNLLIDGASDTRFDIRTLASGQTWTLATNVAGKIVVVTADGIIADTDGDDYPIQTQSYWNSGRTNWYDPGNQYADIYFVLESTVDQTVDIGFGNNGSCPMLFDNIWAYDQTELVSLKGASLNVTDDDLEGMTYISELNLPTGLATNMISTYVAPSKRLENEAYGEKYTFTDATNAGLATKLVSKMRMKAADGGIIMDGNTAKTNGKVYSYFHFYDGMNYTTKYTARTEVALSDINGNDLGIVISTNSGADGLYSGSVNQVKRAMAKQLIAVKNIVPFDFEIPAPTTGHTSKWNSNISDVWNFVLTYKKYLG